MRWFRAESLGRAGTASLAIPMIGSPALARPLRFCVASGSRLTGNAALADRCKRHPAGVRKPPGLRPLPRGTVTVASTFRTVSVPAARSLPNRRRDARLASNRRAGFRAGPNELVVGPDAEGIFPTSITAFEKEVHHVFGRGPDGPILIVHASPSAGPLRGRRSSHPGDATHLLRTPPPPPNIARVPRSTGGSLFATAPGSAAAGPSAVT